MKTLNELTKAQEDRLPEIADAWAEKGLTCAPVDREKIELSAAKAYEAGKLTPPKLFIWEPSPWAGARRAAILFGSLKEEDDVRDKECDAITEQLNNACFGQHDVSWLAFFAAFHEFGVEGVDVLEGLWGMAECGWWWPFDEACVLTERPTELHRDDEGKLHSEEGAAIQWSDGWGVYAFHGVRVPKHVIIAPDTITVEDIKAEEDKEVQKVMISRAKWDVRLQIQLLNFGAPTK